MSTRSLAALVLLAAIWGSSYLFIRVAVDPLGPLMVAFARVGTAGLGLAAYALLTRKREELAGLDRRFLMLGLGNAAVPYVLISFAELHLTARFRKGGRAIQLGVEGPAVGKPVATGLDVVGAIPERSASVVPEHPDVDRVRLVDLAREQQRPIGRRRVRRPPGERVERIPDDERETHRDDDRAELEPPRPATADDKPQKQAAEQRERDCDDGDHTAGPRFGRGGERVCCGPGGCRPRRA